MVVNILKNGATWLISRQQTILSAAFIIMLSTAGSLILGLVRQRLLAAYFGQTVDLLEAYIAASRIPEIVFEVIVFSAVSVAFIPVFSKLIANERNQEAWQLASSVVNLAVIFFMAIGVIIFFAAGNLASWVAPGKTSPQIQETITNLIRLMILPQFFFTISVFLTGILQSFHRFLFPALAAIFYNLGVIVGIVYLSPSLGIFGPAWGMLIGAIFHFAIQLPLATRLGWRLKVRVNFQNHSLATVARLMTPRAIGLAAGRIGDLVNISLASLISTGSVVAFNFAQILYFFPITLFGSSIAQAALPTLSEEFGKNKLDEFKTTLLTSLHQMLFLILPITVILAILRIPAVRLVFGAAQFPWELTVLTGRTLIVFTIGLAAQAVAVLLIRAFYAMHNTRTPVTIGLLSSGVNIGFSFLFVKALHFSVLYLAGAYTIGNVLNALLLLIFLDHKVNCFDRKRLFLPAIKMGAAAFLMAVALYVPIKLLDQVVIDTTRTIGLIILTSIAAFSGLTVYFLLTWVFRLDEVRLLIGLLQKIRSFGVAKVAITAGNPPDPN